MYYRLLILAFWLLVVTVPFIVRGQAVVDFPTPKSRPKISYEVPEGDAQELAQFILRLNGFRATTQKELSEHREKARPAVKAAALRIIKLDKNLSSQSRHLAVQIIISDRLMSLEKGQRPEMEKLVKVLRRHLQTRVPSRADFQFVKFVASHLETLESPDMAIQALRTSADVFIHNRNPHVVLSGQMLTGMARRLELSRNEIRVFGRTLKGEKFDWAQFRGKLVLLDFWATWCGPCKQQMPLLIQLHKAYHDRGFEIIGINMDQRSDSLRKFLQSNPLPWPMLYDSQTNPDESLSLYYGVMALPSMFLVDQDGKVISLNARGRHLQKLLHDRLGPP